MTTFNRVAAATVALTLGTAGVASAEAITIAINEWTGQHLSATIAGSVLQEMGLDVEYVTAGAVPQLAGIAEETINFNPEFWTNNVGDIYDDAVAAGDIVIVGDLGLQPQEGWFYPPYMNDLCPGLPSYEALYDCAQAFAAADTFPNGRLITYPADWGTRSSDLVAQLGLPFQPVAGGSEGAMLAELKSAVAAEQPILMMMWAPHWIHSEIDLDLVTWDRTSPTCESEGPQSRGDACGFAQAEVVKLVSGDFAATWPEALAFVDRYTLTNDIQNALIAKVDEQGMSVEDAVAEWMAANEDTWRAWIDG